MQLCSSVGEVHVCLFVEVQSCVISLGESHSLKGLVHCTVYIYTETKQHNNIKNVMNL